VSRSSEKGIKVWLDEWRLPAGTVASKGMELGVEQSRHVVLVLSQEFLDYSGARREEEKSREQTAVLTRNCVLNDVRPSEI